MPKTVTIPADPSPIQRTRVLLVDDNAMVRESLMMVLGYSDFDVTTTSNVNDALKLIHSEYFDVLVSDLHMPLPGDGLTVVSAMRNWNPKAVTIIFSGYPEMKEAAAAILMQADEVLLKPMGPTALVDTIRDRLKKGHHPGKVCGIESVASILEQESAMTISDWLLRVTLEPEVITVSLEIEDRIAHLPQLFRDLVSRLRKPLPLGTRALVSPAAAEHGRIRRLQGYTAAMMVEESRMLQVSIFQTLQNNLHKADMSLLLVGVMEIADEVDSQLAQAMASYVKESRAEPVSRAA